MNARNPRSIVLLEEKIYSRWWYEQDSEGMVHRKPDRDQAIERMLRRMKPRADSVPSGVCLDSDTLAAWADGFVRVGPVTLILLGVLTALSFAIDFAAAALGAKRVGATKYAIIGAALGTFTGIFFGLPGLLIGPFAGAVTGELLSHGRLPQAARAGMATWVGLLFGTLVKIALVCTMIGIFVAAWFF